MDIKQILTTCFAVIIVFVIFYTSDWQNKKKAKELKIMQDNLKKGDKIITFSGLSGVIEKTEEDRIIISTNPDGIKFEIEKWAVAGLDDRTTEKEE